MKGARTRGIGDTSVLGKPRSSPSEKGPAKRRFDVVSKPARLRHDGHKFADIKNKVDDDSPDNEEDGAGNEAPAICQ